MPPQIHPNALKHLSRDEVLSAWGCVTKCIQRAGNDEPPRWLCIAWLSDGRPVELIAVETADNWLIIHAMTPVQPKLAKEIAQTERRAR